MLVVITGTMKPREAVAAMPIGIWLLFVGAICLANALNLTGAGAMIYVSGAALTAFMSPMATGTVPYYMAAGGYDMRSVLKQSWLPALLFAVVQVAWMSVAFPLH